MTVKINNKYQPKLPVITSQYPVININKINLNEMIYPGNQNNNNLNHIIQANFSNNLKTKNANIILIAHSGNSKISYFKNIYKLKNGDYIYIYNQRIKYIFEVYDKKIINPKDTNKLKHQKQTTLTLLTCFEHNKRLLVIAKLKGVNYH